MMRLIATAILALAMAGPAKAQSWEYLYSAVLGVNDFTNSSGARLGDLCAIVQQDRANYHRFNLRDASDSGDRYFGSREARARIAGQCILGDGYGYIRRDVLNGVPRFVNIYGQFNSRGQVIRVLITEGAG